MPPPRKHKLFFWLILAAYSTFFAEVFAGSDMFPFFNLWGILIVWPLYGLHTIILITLIYRYGSRPRFATLVFAGLLFGLYEAYMTKMLWRPSWEAWLTVADVAVVEVFVLLWWHSWLSFITPLTLAEGLLTTSRDVLRGLPLRLRRFYGSRKGWLALALFGSLIQSINSPDPAASLLSGVSTVAFLTTLTLLWRRVTRGHAYTLSDLLPGKRAFRIMALWLGAMYLFHIFALYPERIPPVWPGQVIIWGLYALAIALLVRALRRFRHVREYRGAPPPFPSAKALLGAGLTFVVALPLVESALGGVAGEIVVVSWLAGSAFEIWTFFRSTWETLTRRENQPLIAQDRQGTHP